MWSLKVDRGCRCRVGLTIKQGGIEIGVFEMEVVEVIGVGGLWLAVGEGQNGPYANLSRLYAKVGQKSTQIQRVTGSINKKEWPSI